MEVVYILGIYILSVFLNRLINKIGNRLTDTSERHVKLWFLSVIYTIGITIIILILVCEDRDNKFIRWFKGEHWD